MSASQPSGNWQRVESVCVCVRARRVYLSVILVFYFLCAQTRTITLNCASLCFAPFLSHSLSVFLYHSPFLSVFPSKKWISPLYTPLSNYFGEEGGKKRERRERGYIQKEREKRIRRILVLLYTNAIKKWGLEGHDGLLKKRLIPAGEAGGGGSEWINRHDWLFGGWNPELWLAERLWGGGSDWSMRLWERGDPD